MFGRRQRQTVKQNDHWENIGIIPSTYWFGYER